MINDESKGKVRTQFDFTPEVINILERLQTKITATSKAEVVRRAVRFFKWFVEEVPADSVIVVQDKDGAVIYKVPLRTLF